MMNEKNRDIQDKILLTALEDVPFDGWTWQGIEQAAVKAGFKADMAGAVFPERVSGVLRHFSAWADRQMLAALEGVDINDMRVRDRIKTAVTTRLEVLEPYKESVRASSVYWLSPFRKADAAKMVWSSADVIWNWAGDTATDYNHYSKRFLLSGVMTTTMVRWLNDMSEGHKETLAFLDRRIDNVLTFGRMAGSLLGGFGRKKAR
ncbi:MAG TPA: COQ9 family protein [Alphaproteobacteria bacterium]|nr:COQ9 family protein [Alphaproteobacteria bacterium]